MDSILLGGSVRNIRRVVMLSIVDARCDLGKVLAGLEDIRQFVHLEDKILKLVGPSGWMES
jgi:hypothetical protein